MSRGGAASAVLVFAVLCLAIFTAVSYVSALNEQTLVRNELHLVQAYYQADTFAEKILAEILATGYVPEYVNGIQIHSYWDLDHGIVTFVHPISENVDLYVSLRFEYDMLTAQIESYEILAWRMHSAGEWIADESLNVWQGEYSFSW
ncbi:MAG: hypothetical protein FWC78_07000 [Defluviitaleaceae bacterium]|nr:hypothetical protein [Defluviitaleaceae bacterium]